MHDPTDVLIALAAIAASNDDRATRAKEAAEQIRRAWGFHWVGLYDVTPSEISAIAWTGTAAPAFPAFPRTQGLNGAAVAEQRPIVVNDVRNDSRYLTTFGSTLAEAIFPIRSGETIVGTIDVESNCVNAFAADDVQFLAQCAQILAPLWSTPPPGNLAIDTPGS